MNIKNKTFYFFGNFLLIFANALLFHYWIFVAQTYKKKIGKKLNISSQTCINAVGTVVIDWLLLNGNARFIKWA